MEVSCTPDGKLSFHRINGSLTPSSDLSSRIHFVKRSICPPLSPENIANYVDIHVWRGDCTPLDSLYTALHGIWNPMLLSGNGEKSSKQSSSAYNVTPRVQQLLTELEATLKITVNHAEEKNVTRGSGINNLDDIHEPVDEISFWGKLKNDSRSSFKHLARSVDEALSDICTGDSNGDGGSHSGFNCNTDELLSMDDFTKVVDKLLDALNSVWNVSIAASNGDDEPMVYPQARMGHFFDIIGSAVSRFVLNYLSTVNVWYDRISDVRVKLLYAIQVLQLWSDIPKKLTKTYWMGRQELCGWLFRIIFAST